MRQRKTTTGIAAGVLAASLVAAACGPPFPGGPGGPGGGGGGQGSHGERFERIASFPVFSNNADPSEETVAEIADVTPDGRTLIYTDAIVGQIGFVDIADASRPKPGGTLAVDGSPTSVATTGRYALVAVDTTDDLTAPSGHLAVVDVARRSIVGTLPVAGQPDSIKVSPDGRYAALVIENQRDEEVEVDGVEGGLPQAPGGLLQIVDLRPGGPGNWQTRDVDLSGLSAYAPGDPEPEFVDVDKDNRAVVTLQENNHVAVVDLRTGRVTGGFDAGTVDLSGIDTEDDGRIELSGSLADVPREPDGVSWVPGGKIATANEGDLFGGSRGFTIFGKDGRVAYDSGNTVDQLAVQHGHYPDSRSDAKGTEPEGVEYGRYGNDDVLFVGSERGNFVAVYELPGSSSRGRSAEPRFQQLLPTGMGPEGMVAVPSRDLLVVTSETDAPPNGIRTVVSIFERTRGEVSYPQVVSDDDPATGAPIPWSALSGLAADPRRSSTLYAVSDSAYADAHIYTLDVGDTPAVVERETVVTGATGSLDLEGIAVAPDGTRWLASEGNASDSIPNRLLQVDRDGAVLAEIGLPADVLACRAASTNRGTLGSGFEGLAVQPARGGGYVLRVAQQRAGTTPRPAARTSTTTRPAPTPASPARPGSGPTTRPAAAAGATCRTSSSRSRRSPRGSGCPRS